jgi:hypothetical protein
MRRGLWPEMEIGGTGLRQCGGLFLPGAGLIAAIIRCTDSPIAVGSRNGMVEGHTGILGAFGVQLPNEYGNLTC